MISIGRASFGLRATALLVHRLDPPGLAACDARATSAQRPHYIDRRPRRLVPLVAVAIDLLRMPDPVSRLNSNAQSILPTIVEHLPTVHSNPELASAIFAFIHKAHRTSDPERFILPLLPWLTSLALTVPPNLLLPTAHLIVTLVSSIPPASRAFVHSNTFVSELVALTVRLLETPRPGPVHFCLPSFPLVTPTPNNLTNGSNIPADENEKDDSTPLPNADDRAPSCNTTNTSIDPDQPLLLTPSALYAALVLLALHVPSTNPLLLPFDAPSSPTSSNTTTFAAKLTSVIRLWRGLNAYPRAALLNLASRHELISSSYGSNIADVATHILLRALDPVNTVPVPRPLRDRIARVSSDLVPHALDPTVLLRVIAAARTRSVLPASVALPLALTNHGSVGHAVRSMSRTAKLDLFTHVRTPQFPTASVYRPRKRHRPNPPADHPSRGQENMQLQLSQRENREHGTAVENKSKLQNRATASAQRRRFSHSRSPASILQKYVVESQSSNGGQQTSTSVRLLANAVSITADALNALLNAHAVSLPSASIRSGRLEWPNVAASLSDVVIECVRRFSNAPMKTLWPSMLFLGQATLHLCVALCSIGDNLGAHIVSAGNVLRDALLAIVPLAFEALENSMDNFPVESFASLLQYIGDAALENPGFLGEQSVFSECVLKITQFVIALPENLQSGQHAALIKASFHAKLAVVDAGQCPSKASNFVTPDAPKRLSTIIKNYLTDFPSLSAAGLTALADELCFSLGCCQSHVPRSNWDRIQVKPIRRLTDSKPWNPALDAVVHSSLCSNVNSDISSGVVRCMSAMAVHCPTTRRPAFANVLIDLLWSVCNQRILDMILSSLSYLLECEKKGVFDALSGTEANPIDIDADGSEDTENRFVIANLILSRLKSCIDQISQALTNKTIPRDINLRAISYHLLLSFDDTFAPQVSALVCPTLLQVYSIELLSNDLASSEQNRWAISNSTCPRRNMEFWSDLFATAMTLHQRSDPNRVIYTGRVFGGGADIAKVERGLFNMSLSAPQAVSNMFLSRIADWGHLLLDRMLNDNSFCAVVSIITVETSGRSFWNRFPRHVVTPLLLRNDIALLNSLAQKLNTTLKQMVEKSVADAMAMMLMNPSLDNQSFSVISRILEKPINDVMASKAGKVVQRLVMEFGGAREEQSKIALTKFARLIKPLNQGSNSDDLEHETGEALSGSLVASHFLLVMDAVNRRLFQSKATENEQLRHLRMLKSILLLSKHHIHAFVPKILATLKLALDSFGNNQFVYEETVQVWSSFLETLGSERILVHVTSILAIISPLLNQIDNTFCQTLASLIQKSAMQSHNERSLVVLLLRMSNQELLAKTADMLERPESNLGVDGALRSSEDSALRMSVPAIERLCRDVGKIIAQHGNGVIEVMAAQYMLRVLRTNQDKMDDAARSQFSESQSASGSLTGACLATLQALLVEQLSITRNIQCLRVIIQCIGEVGAIDPAIVSRGSTAGSTRSKEPSSSKAPQEMPRSIHALVALLLDNFLVPTLLAQGEIRSASTSRINRIGLVIQELIRVCGCKRNTAARASKSARVRKREDGPVKWDEVLVGETNEENAIYFWENLLPETRDVITPYLSEPFDVQHYKGVFGANAAGNEDLACLPVWSKIKAAVSAGAVANAQEWRRQTAVQLVDFIGKQGSFGEVLQSLRPILRYEDSTTAFIFPMVLMTALDLAVTKRSKRLKNFLIEEVAEVLKEAGAPKIMFDLFDTLRHWREGRSVQKAHIAAMRVLQGNSHIAIARRKAAIPKYTETAKREDSLSCFVDLYENYSSSISLLAKARCAFRTRSYARAILLAENHLRLKRSSDQLRIWPASMELVLGKISTHGPGDSDDAEAVKILQKCFAELEDADSLRGLAALRSSSTLGEQVIDCEVSGRFHEALITYERAIAQSPRSVQFHRGFLRCLKTLGHWETMLAHSEGLGHSADSTEMELRRMAEANGIEAAWRLGRWDNIQSFDHVPLDAVVQSAQDVEPAHSWDNDFAISFGNVLVALHDRDPDALRIAADGARENLLIPIIRAALEGYNRTYPMIVRLHAVSDVESTLEEILLTESPKNGGGKTQGQKRPTLLPNGNDQLPKLISMPGRTLMTALSLKFREPILSTKRVCFEQLNMFDEAARVSLELAAIAKEGENLRSAAATVFRGLCMNCKDQGVKHALVMETAQIQRLQGDAPGALLVVKEEINRLKKLVNYHKEKGATTTARQVTDWLTNALVVAGSWIAHSRSEPSQVVLEYFQQAKQNGPYREEPFYALGRHYDLLLQASVNADEDLNVDESQSQGRSSTRRNTGGSSATPVETHAPEHSSKYVPLVIKSYARTLCNGHSRLFEAMPRMLTVWFEYYTGLDGSDGYKGMAVEGQVRDVVKLAVQGIPVYMWMTAIPQLMSRILHKRKFVRDELAHILARVICFYPDQTYWTIVPATQLKRSAARKKTITDILNHAIMMMRKDRKREFAAEVKDRFRDRVYNWLLIMTCFVEICEARGRDDRRGRMDNCGKEFRELKSQLRVSGLVNPMIPTLNALTARLPSTDVLRDPRAAVNAAVIAEHQHKPFDYDTVRIAGIDDHVLVMSSLMCPRRITLLGTDGRPYRYLAKREDKGDMRRDSRVVEFLTLLNELLSRERKDVLPGSGSSSSTSSSPNSSPSMSSSASTSSLNLKTYSVLPLTEETGMIEWVNDLCPFRTLVGHQHARLQQVPSQNVIKERYDELSDKRTFLEWAWSQFPPLLDRYYVSQFGGGGGHAHAWLAARDEWTRSAAVWSMAGHIVGLGDRHGENVLIDTTSGRCVHVDFAMLFEKARKLRVPEVVPFRLTQNMVAVMGVAGYEGVFRAICERMMRLVRSNADALLSRLESFLYDPLVDWAGSETPGAKAGVVASRDAWLARATVKAKLTGMVDKSGLALSIEGQVQRLIREATSADNLARMYIWWGAWI